MKKGFITLLSIFLLAACENNEPNIEYPSTIDTTDKENNASDQPQNEQENNENQEDPKTSDANNGHLQDFEEFSTLSTHLDLSTHTGTVETDNKGNRIIIFANENGQKEYKSIFLKHDNRLKIVTFNDESPLYNDVIQ